MPVAGGMMAIGIPEYRLPRAELHRDIDAIRALGVTFHFNTAIGRDIDFRQLQQEFDTVLLAVGAQRSQRLGIAGELVWEGVIPATTFLKDFNLNPKQSLPGRWRSLAEAALLWMLHVQPCALAHSRSRSSIAVLEWRCPRRLRRCARLRRKASSCKNWSHPCNCSARTER